MEFKNTDDDVSLGTEYSRNVENCVSIDSVDSKICFIIPLSIDKYYVYWMIRPNCIYLYIISNNKYWSDYKSTGLCIGINFAWNFILESNDNRLQNCECVVVNGKAVIMHPFCCF